VAGWIFRAARPIAGVLIADYFFTRKTVLYQEELFKADGAHQASAGWIGLGFCVRRGRGATCARLFACGEAVDLIPAAFEHVYHYAWFVGFAASGVYATSTRVSRE